MRRRSVLVLLLLLGLTASGCWDRREVEEIAFVLGVGVDPGERSTYSVTFLVALPEKMAGGGGGGGGGGGDGGGGGGGGDGKEKPYLITTIEAATIADAINLINTEIDRRVSLQHTKAVLMSEEIARLGGLRAIDEFTRFREARRSLYYFVTKGRAAEFLNQMDPKTETDPQRYFVQMASASRYTGMLPANSQVHHLVTSTHTGYQSPVTLYAALKEEAAPAAAQGSAGNGAGGQKSESGSKGARQTMAGELPSQGGPNVAVLGAAAFRHDRMVGVLNGDETRSLLMLQGRFQQGFVSVPDPRQPGLYLSLDLRRSRPNTFHVDLSGARPQISVKVSLEGEVLAIQAIRDYTEPELQLLVEETASRDIRESIERVITKSQRWEADIGGLGRSVVRLFPTVQSWEQYDWPSQYKNAEIRVLVSVRLRRFGLQLSPPTVRD